MSRYTKPVMCKKNKTRPSTHFFLVLLILSALLLAAACTVPTVYLPEGVYYVDSESGDDNADGLSPDTAWRSLDKLSYTVTAPGSQILFKSGLVFRGSLQPSSGTALKPVVYSTYGGEQKAYIQNSIDLGAEDDWTQAGAGVWRAAGTVFGDDVGNIIFDGTICAVRKWSVTGLTDQNDYYFDRFWKVLYLKSSTNPAALHASVEAALTRHVVDHSNVSFAAFSNLHIRYGGAHGFGGGGTKGLYIHDCEFSYLGGGYLYTSDGEPVRYGNGIEFWGDAADNTVENCRFHDIYDTGVTNQNHSMAAVQDNITYRNNVIESCGLASFEFWNRPSSSVMSNISFENNTSVNPGTGWGGEQRPDEQGSHVSVFGNESQLEKISIRNNIFYGGNLIYFFDQGTFDSPEVEAYENCLYPVEDGSYDYLCVVWDDKSLESSVKYDASSLPLLQADSGRETGSVSADPQFEMFEYPYTFLTGSPCTGWGALAD